MKENVRGIVPVREVPPVEEMLGGVMMKMVNGNAVKTSVRLVLILENVNIHVLALQDVRIARNGPENVWINLSLKISPADWWGMFLFPLNVIFVLDRNIHVNVRMDSPSNGE